jgi:hypothetical protein
MATVAPTDESHAKGLIALSNVGDGTFVQLWADPVTHRLLVDLAGGSGSVTSVSVVSANGLAGTVATATTTPAITLSTTITGVLKGNGTAISAATAGTDYQAPITLTTTGTSGAATFISNTLNIPNYANTTYAAGTGLTLTTGTFSVNTSQNIATLSNLTSNGIVTTSGGAGTLGVTATNGSGNVVLTTSPTLVTPTLGAALATTINGNTFTTGTYTLTGTAGKTLTFQNSITIAGTDSTTMTFPSTSATIARTDAAQTFTGTQTFSQVVTTVNAITAVANAATVPITSRISNVTNNSAATLTITLTTASAVDGQLVMVRIYDFSAVTQTLTFVNTENSAVTVPTTSNGSTTLPITVGFQFNSATTKWRCIASA